MRIPKIKISKKLLSMLFVYYLKNLLPQETDFILIKEIKA